MTQTTKLLAILALFGALVAAGCGGGSEEASEPLTPGVYEFELTEQYLLDKGISAQQAANESGLQTFTLRGDGTFTVTWRTAKGTTGACEGTYEEGEDRQVTFRWTKGCFGDWSTRYSVDDDQVMWSDQRALPPYDSAEDQKVNEVFNAVPWTRVGDAS